MTAAAAGLVDSTTELTSDFPTEGDIMSSANPLRTQQSATTQTFFYYRQQLHHMKNEGENTLYVDFGHVFRFNDVLATAIAEEFYRFESYLRKALQLFVQKYMPQYLVINNSSELREFYVGFYGLSVVNKLRELTTQRIGQLVSVSATVTRTSEVRPELTVATFQCLECRSIVRDVEQQFKFTEPTICINPLCQNRRKWKLIIEKSTFLDWQKIHVQENSSEIPAGSMPRNLDVIVRNDLVERAKAGDRCVFTGCLIVIPDVSQLTFSGGKVESVAEEGRRSSHRDGGIDGGITGLRGLGVRELNYKLAFMACMIQPANARLVNYTFRTEGELGDEDVAELFTAEEQQEIQRMKSTPQLYHRLVESMTPTIFGHAHIKAGILLMLFGGIHKTTAEGIGLRGDINVCIVGDPGTAKSQFLKYVVGFLPRSVYTSGKASSAAGLTASVVKDQETGEFTIEAGALMLADNGVCAIDEFDKMDLGDQVAIHEAMEQQTISIAKAGIQATLNARTSILAAANPIGGRYDRKKTLRQNIAMTAPIMSRFDLFFVLLDECNDTADYNIARHILGIHRHQDDAVRPEFSMEQMQRFIRYARTLKPKASKPLIQMAKESALLLVDKYRQMRQGELSGPGTSFRMTVRQLESMIRLSEALARLHCDEEVRPRYVQEAARLLQSSVLHLQSDEVVLGLGEEEPQLGRMTSTVASEKGEETAAGGAGEERIRIKYETYARITSMLVYCLRRHEAGDEAGMGRDALVEWYLETIEGEIESEADLHAKTREVRAVIERLVHRDGVLVEIGEEKRLVVYPNYVPKE